MNCAVLIVKSYHGTYLIRRGMQQIMERCHKSALGTSFLQKMIFEARQCSWRRSGLQHISRGSHADESGFHKGSVLAPAEAGAQPKAKHVGGKGGTRKVAPHELLTAERAVYKLCIRGCQSQMLSFITEYGLP